MNKDFRIHGLHYITFRSLPNHNKNYPGDLNTFLGVIWKKNVKKYFLS